MENSLSRYFLLVLPSYCTSANHFRFLVRKYKWKMQVLLYFSSRYSRKIPKYRISELFEKESKLNIIKFLLQNKILSRIEMFSLETATCLNSKRPPVTMEAGYGHVVLACLEKGVKTNKRRIQSSLIPRSFW